MSHRQFNPWCHRLCYRPCDQQYSQQHDQRWLRRWPKRWLRSGLLSLLSVSIAPFTLAAPAPLCVQQLPAKINAIVQQPKLQRSRVGILVQSLDAAKPKTLYARDAQQYFIPASNVKLFTTAAALQTLRPSDRIATSIYGAYRDSGWRLRLVGRGDPSLTDTQLRQLVQQLSDRGIRQVTELIIEDTYFVGNPLNSKWQIEDIQFADAVPVNSVILNQNTIGLQLFPQAIGQPLKIQWDDPQSAISWQVNNRTMTVHPQAEESIEVERQLSAPIVTLFGQLRVGAAPETATIGVLNPTDHISQKLQQALSSAGISAQQITTQQQIADPFGIEVARIESPPIAELLREVNQNSNNLYAEALLRAIGIRHAKPGQSTPDRGVAAVTEVLQGFGIQPDEISLVDGSGLARQNLSTPAALVKVLQAMARHPQSQVFRSSLPIAGVSGSLANRFRKTAAAGIVQAKTGSLSGVISLSGYANPPQYRPIVFSILLNQVPGSTTLARIPIDEIILLLVRLKSC